MPEHYFDRPRSYPAATALRLTEPYHFQRGRNGSRTNFPRPAQPNTNQPNQRFDNMGDLGMSTRDYWNGVFEDYLKRKKLTQQTSLRLGRK